MEDCTEMEKGLNELPVIIDSTGKYVTRGGDIVLVHKITEPNDPQNTAFCAKGSILKKTKHGFKATRYDAWHISGRWAALAENNLDIVQKIENN